MDKQQSDRQQMTEYKIIFIFTTRTKRKMGMGMIKC